MARAHAPVAWPQHRCASGLGIAHEAPYNSSLRCQPTRSSGPAHPAAAAPSCWPPVRTNAPNSIQPCPRHSSPLTTCQLTHLHKDPPHALPARPLPRSPASPAHLSRSPTAPSPSPSPLTPYSLPQLASPAPADSRMAPSRTPSTLTRAASRPHLRLPHHRRRLHLVLDRCLRRLHGGSSHLLGLGGGGLGGNGLRVGQKTPSKQLLLPTYAHIAPPHTRDEAMAASAATA